MHRIINTWRMSHGNLWKPSDVELLQRQYHFFIPQIYIEQLLCSGSTVVPGHSRGKLAKKLPWRNATYILVNVGPGKFLLRATHCSK